jgi:hypothetical protein
MRHAYPKPNNISTASIISTEVLQPQFEKLWYRCVIDGKYLLKSYHWSGILLFRQLESGATRVVFQAEMGTTFFDFEWDDKGVFFVHRIFEAMNKPALIATLRKDFEMLLLNNKSPKPDAVHQFQNNSFTYYQYSLSKGFVYYLVNNKMEWVGIENADEKKKVTIFHFASPTPIGKMPEQFTIQHLKAHFSIQLTQFNPELSNNDTTE